MIIIHFEIELKKLDDEFQNSRLVRHLHVSMKDSDLRKDSKQSGVSRTQNKGTLYQSLNLHSSGFRVLRTP